MFKVNNKDTKKMENGKMEQTAIFHNVTEWLLLRVK